jgi:squalene synthase HpnC
MVARAVAPAPEVFVARARAENFPVALRVLPRDRRAQLLAIYGFARLVDDTGDEATGDRLALLDELEAELDRALAGTATHPVFVPLQATIRAGSLPDEPFRRLIEANRRDQRVHRYATWDDLRDYCAYSADPVGRLVLGVFGATTPARVRWSDDVCTGLQLLEHLQDVGEDRRRGRVYLPEEDMARFGCPPAALDDPMASPGLRRVVAFECERARRLLASGTVLAHDVSGHARLAVAGFTAGGLATLDRIARVDFDVLAHRARPTRLGTAGHVVGVLAAGSRVPRRATVPA